MGRADKDINFNYPNIAENHASIVVEGQNIYLQK
ncbi:MAG: hypothetical protein KDD45_13195 [Bdellovibrionales bacterium]|nr:hypothetical protein [Bdellovibrionales bacterium]